MTNGKDPDAEPRPPEAENLVRLMAGTAHGMRRYVEGTMPQLPGGMSAWGVLRVLYHRGPTTQAELARHLDVAGSTLTRRLEQMEADGLVERRDDPDDGRRVIVTLTDVGEAIRAKHREHCAAQIDRLTAGAAAADVEALRRVLAVIRSNLAAMGADAEDHRGRSGRRGGRRAHSRGLRGLEVQGLGSREHARGLGEGTA